MLVLIYLLSAHSETNFLIPLISPSGDKPPPPPFKGPPKTPYERAEAQGL